MIRGKSIILGNVRSYLQPVLGQLQGPLGFVEVDVLHGGQGLVVDEGSVADGLDILDGEHPAEPRVQQVWPLSQFFLFPFL